MSRDTDELFRKFEQLDRELKELKAEVSNMKWYQQHGTNGAVAYSTQNDLMTSTPLPIGMSTRYESFVTTKEYFYEGDLK